MPSLWTIFKHSNRNLFNLLLFLPYYFNVTAHLKHLFAPWKQIAGMKKTKGFSLNVQLENISMSLVSRSIGFLLRSGVLLVYFVCSGFLTLIIVPVWVILSFITVPLVYVFMFVRNPVEHKKREREFFIKSHVLEEKNMIAVEQWFEQLYLEKNKRKDFLSLENLFAVPPIGRDWSYGFTPTLEDYATDLTVSLSYKTHLLGRSEEVRLIEQALVKSYEANALLVGTEGVGRHTILEGLAHRLSQGTANVLLSSMRLLVLNMEKILAERDTFEQKEELLESLLTEAELAKNNIIVVADFHKYCTSSLSGDYSEVWEKFGKSSAIKFIGITTPFFYEHIIYHNEKVKQLFNRVDVAEISMDKALAILKEKALLFERLYGLTITYESIQRVLERSRYFITHIPFPEKAITVLDEVCVQLKNEGKTKVMPDDVDRVLSAKLHIPIGHLSGEMRHKLLQLESLLGKYIVGQQHVLSEVARTFRRAHIEENRMRPKASFLFLGPTGVGKTLTAKTLAKIFFDSAENLTRFDMSFYQKKEALSELIGSFESRNPGLLATRIREKPYCVLLIDEIEKASREILNIFLTLLDEGYLIDGYGQRVDAKNLIVMATSNAASADIQQWVNEGKKGHELEKLVRDFVVERGVFSPELLNRFDKVLVFEPLSQQQAIAIAYGMLERTIREYEQQKQIKITIPVTELASWVHEAFDPKNGVREIERTVRDHVAEHVSKILLG